jgi:hypothetical protein
MTDSFSFTTVEAIRHIAKEYDINTLSAFARELSNDDIKIQPIQISNYLKGRKMSRKVANQFLVRFGVIITDFAGADTFATPSLIEE